MTYFVYVLKSLRDGRFYTGSTENLVKRIARHNKGHANYTKRNGPFELVYSETLATRAQAVRREKQLKTGKGRDELKRILMSIGHGGQDG